MWSLFHKPLHPQSCILIQLYGIPTWVEPQAAPQVLQLAAVVAYWFASVQKLNVKKKAKQTLM